MSGSSPKSELAVSWEGRPLCHSNYSLLNFIYDCTRAEIIFYSRGGFTDAAVQHLVVDTVATRIWRAELRPIAAGMYLHQLTYYKCACSYSSQNQDLP